MLHKPIKLLHNKVVNRMTRQPIKINIQIHKDYTH